MNKVDWTKPIEAAHQDGRVVAVALELRSDNPDESGDYYTTGDFDGFSGIWNPGGLPWIAMDGWRIRNVANANDTVTVKRMTREEAEKFGMLRGYDGFDGKNGEAHYYGAMRDLGLIKHDPSPLEQFLADHPDADRATAELAFARWGGEQ